MGFESFQIRLRGGTASRSQALEAVRQLPGARPDPDGGFGPGSDYFTVADGRHVIEVEVSGPPVAVSCRFALCHPLSAAGALAKLAAELADRLGMEALICDEVSAEHAGWFAAGRMAELAAALPAYVAARRAEWVAQVGPGELAATTREAFERFILPLCVPLKPTPAAAGGSASSTRG